MITNQNDFFTLQTLGTFAGAVGATAVISNGCQQAFNFNPRWLGFSIAEAICIGAAFLPSLETTVDLPAAIPAILVAIVNGFLVFTSAAGLTNVGHTVKSNSRRSKTPKVRMKSWTPASSITQPNRRNFFTPWFEA
jgi:hypothetical protein